MEIKRFDDFIICPIPAESELDQVEIEKIVAHTRNTWQHDRQNGEIPEKLRDLYDIMNKFYKKFKKAFMP